MGLTIQQAARDLQTDPVNYQLWEIDGLANTHPNVELLLKFVNRPVLLLIEDLEELMDAIDDAEEDPDLPDFSLRLDWHADRSKALLTLFLAAFAGTRNASLDLT